MTDVPVSNMHDNAFDNDRSVTTADVKTTERARLPDVIGSLPRSVVDPKGGRDRGRNVLVVSTVESSGELLHQYVSPTDTIKVVVPAVRQGFLDWLANDEGAFSHAEEVAADTAERLPGHSVRSSAGEADVELAIRDALATLLLTRSFLRSGATTTRASWSRWLPRAPLVATSTGYPSGASSSLSRDLSA